MEFLEIPIIAVLLLVAYVINKTILKKYWKENDIPNHEALGMMTLIFILSIPASLFYLVMYFLMYVLLRGFGAVGELPKSNMLLYCIVLSYATSVAVSLFANRPRK